MADEGQGSNLPTADQIMTALDRTGFILEHKVHQILENLDFYSFLNDPFADPETGKSREIDVVASTCRVIPSRGKKKVMVTITLLVECKNYTDPLAIIGHDISYGLQHGRPIIDFDPLAFKFANRDPDEHTGIERRLELWKRSSHMTKGFIGNQLVRMHRQNGRWQATNDSVYDSIVLPLAKAVEAEETELCDPDDAPWILPTITYCLAVLVTSGSVFTIDMTESSAPKVSRVPWAPLLRKFSDRHFMMDVVTYDAVEEYVNKRVFSLLDDAHKVARSHSKLFDPVWLEKEYGESSDPEFNAWLEYFRAGKPLKIKKK